MNDVLETLRLRRERAKALQVMQAAKGVYQPMIAVREEAAK